MDKDLKFLDERYVKRTEYIELITSMKKDLSTIKWILGVIATSAVGAIIAAIFKLILRG